MVKYDAFISYSRSADGVLAPKIREGLQKLAKPWNRRRALNVFLDQASLEISAGLKEALEAKLDSTDWLIVLLSEDSARSQWVGAEIERWLATKPRDRLLLIQTGGELHWVDGDWDWERSTAAHRALWGVYSDVPLWLDLRKYRHATDLDIRTNNDFRNDIATLAARLHGMSKEELVGEDLVQFRKFRRVRRVAIAGLAVLTVAAVTASVIALIARDRAVEAEAEAVKEARIAATRQIAAQAQVESPHQPDLSWLLAVASKDLGDQLLADGDIGQQLVESRAALLNTLAATPELVGYLPIVERVTAVAAEPGVPLLATGDSAGTVALWNVATMEQVEVIEVSNEAVSSIALTADGSVLAAATDAGDLTLWATSTGSRIAVAATVREWSTSCSTTVEVSLPSPRAIRMAKRSNYVTPGPARPLVRGSPI